MQKIAEVSIVQMTWMYYYKHIDIRYISWMMENNKDREIKILR